MQNSFRFTIAASLFSLTLASATNAWAGAYLVQDATVTAVHVGPNDSNGIAINITGGTGGCASNLDVELRESYTSWERIKLAWAAAITAFVSGRHISVYAHGIGSTVNVANGDCLKGTMLTIQ